MKVIDFEAHYYPKEFVDELFKRTELPRIDPETGMFLYTGTDSSVEWELIGGPKGRDLMDIGDFRISEMDASGTDMQILSAAQGIEMLPPETGIPIAHAANLHVYEAMQKYPGRFQGMAALPLIDVEASLKELEICAKEYGFVGVNLFSDLGNGNHPDDEKYEPIFAAAEKYGMFVYLHPAFSSIERLQGAGPFITCATLGFGVDTLITFARILARGIFDRYPNLKIMLGHFGEGIPFIYDRFNDHSLEGFNLEANRGNARNQHKFGHNIHNNLYVTSSGMTSADAFELTKKVLGIDKIMFGSDYPMDRPHHRTREFIEDIPMSKKDREKIFCGNANRVYGI